MNADKQRELADLLAEASAAHNEHEQRELGGVYDQEWPSWYAAYLVEHGISGLLGESITVENLAGLLARYDKEYTSQQRPESWPAYYAAQLLNKGAEK